MNGESKGSPRTDYEILKINQLAVRLGCESKRPERVEGRMANYDAVSRVSCCDSKPRGGRWSYNGTLGGVIIKVEGKGTKSVNSLRFGEAFQLFCAAGMSQFL